jgi:hypothetical protein
LAAKVTSDENDRNDEMLGTADGNNLNQDNDEGHGRE